MPRPPKTPTLGSPEHWLKLAAQDLKAARILRKETDPLGAQICFFSQ